MKSSKTPIIIAVLIPIITVVIALGMVYAKKSNLSGYDEFPYKAYLDASSDMEGNKYLMRAMIKRQLANLGENGRVESVSMDNENAEIAVLIPNSIVQNVSTNQRYKMVVEIMEKGRILANEMQKY